MLSHILDDYADVRYAGMSRCSKSVSLGPSL